MDLEAWLWLIFGATPMIAGTGALFTRYRHHPRSKLLHDAAILLAILLAFAVPALHAGLLLVDARREQIGLAIHWETCADPNKAAALGAYDDTCARATQHGRPLLAIWLGKLWDRGLFGLYFGFTLGEKIESLANANPWSLAVQVAMLVGIPLTLAVVAVREGWTGARGAPTVVSRTADEVCFKLPNGTVECVCLHKSKERGGTPAPDAVAAGPSL